MNKNFSEVIPGSQKKKKHKSHQGWSWIIIISFFILSIYNVYFGLLGFLCMTMPMYHALKGEGKAHCSFYCPRGSFLGKFLGRFSMQNTLPGFMRTKKFKNGMLVLMITMLSLSMIHSGGQIDKIAFALFRFMFASFIVGILMGVFFKPRSWCQICPMGHATGLITDIKKMNNPASKKSDTKKENKIA